jgi:tight adherence protein B
VLMVKTKIKRIERYFTNLSLASGVFIFSLTLSHSVIIALSISCISTFIFGNVKRNSSNKSNEKLSAVVPQIIDYVISGIQSGLSLTEALINLKLRGPSISRGIFEIFETCITQGNSFEHSISEVQERFDSASADQFFEALIFAKSLGGRELLTLLRQLSAFIRRDLALRDEISAKQGWVRNSAHVSAAAPWLLLLLLSAQPSTSKAYSTFTGLLVLAFGALATLIAYIWMSHLSRLPDPKRVFGGR